MFQNLKCVQNKSVSNQKCFKIKSVSKSIVHKINIPTDLQVQFSMLREVLVWNFWGKEIWYKHRLWILTHFLFWHTFYFDTLLMLTHLLFFLNYLLWRTFVFLHTFDFDTLMILTHPSCLHTFDFFLYWHTFDNYTIDFDSTLILKL